MDREPAHVVEDLCARELGAGVRRELFCHIGRAVVYGLELGDGRRIVVKAHPPERELDMLQQMIAVQNHLASRGLYAPTVVGGPLAMGAHLVTLEALVEGAPGDPADPALRRRLAEAGARIIAACQPLAAAAGRLPLDTDPSLPPGVVRLGHGDWTPANARYSRGWLVVAYGWGNLRRWVHRSVDSPSG
jgi:hypothetical protein